MLHKLVTMLRRYNVTQISDVTYKYANVLQRETNGTGNYCPKLSDSGGLGFERTGRVSKFVVNHNFEQSRMGRVPEFCPAKALLLLTAVADGWMPASAISVVQAGDQTTGAVCRRCRRRVSAALVRAIGQAPGPCRTSPMIGRAGNKPLNYATTGHVSGADRKSAPILHGSRVFFTLGVNTFSRKCIVQTKSIRRLKTTLTNDITLKCACPIINQNPSITSYRYRCSLITSHCL